MLKAFLLASGARKDARSALDSSEERLIAALGPRPEFDAVRNPEHGRLAAAMDRVRIDELREDLVVAEDQAEKQPSTWGLKLGLLAALAVEATGALLLSRSLGLTPSERLFLGPALAAGVVALTVFIGHRSARSAERGGQPRALADRAGHAFRRVLAIIAYVVVVAAISAVRLRASGDDEATTVDALAETALYVLMSVGPAWIVAWLAAKHAPAKAAKNRVRTLRRRLRRSERDQKHAEREIERITREGRRWDGEAARHRALFRVEHRLENAKVERERQEAAARREGKRSIK